MEKNRNEEIYVDPVFASCDTEAAPRIMNECRMGKWRKNEN